MKKTKLLSFFLATVLNLLLAQSTLAAMGSSASYILDSADVVNNGSTGTSPSYGLTGVTGDNFDGESASASYTNCAGLLEETFNDCVAPPAPPPPPPPPAGGGGPGGLPPDKEELEEPIQPEEPTEPEEPTQPVEPQEPEQPEIPEPGVPSLPPLPEYPEEEPMQPEEPGPIALATNIVPFPPIIDEGLLFRDNVWCADYFCFYPETELRGAPGEPRPAPLWPLILILLVLIILAAKLLSEEEKNRK